MTKQDCKFAPGTLVNYYESNNLVGVYIAAGTKFFRQGPASFCLPDGREFFICLGTMYQLGESYIPLDAEVNYQPMALGPSEVHIWGQYNYEVLNRMSENAVPPSWTCRVVMARHHFSGSFDPVPCKFTLGPQKDNELSAALHKFFPQGGRG